MKEKESRCDCYGNNYRGGAWKFWDIQKFKKNVWTHFPTLILWWYFQGDVWLETSHFGFKYYCYLCMDARVYEVTEWGACQVRVSTYWLAFNTIPYDLVILFSSNVTVRSPRCFGVSLVSMWLLLFVYFPGPSPLGRPPWSLQKRSSNGLTRLTFVTNHMPSYYCLYISNIAPFLAHSYLFSIIYFCKLEPW